MGRIVLAELSCGTVALSVNSSFRPSPSLPMRGERYYTYKIAICFSISWAEIESSGETIIYFKIS